MSKTRPLQKSFIGGVMSPAMHARVVDDVRAQNGFGASTRNVQVLQNGGAMRRRGLRHVAHTKDGLPGSTKTSVLRAFDLGSDQSLQIEIGEGYFRFHQFGAPLRWAPPLEVDLNGTGVTDIVKFTEPHGLAVDDELQFTHSSNVDTNLPGALVASVTYFVHTVVDRKSIKVKATIGGGIQAVTDAGTATSYVFRKAAVPKNYFTSRSIASTNPPIVPATDTIDLATPHNFAMGDPVRFSNPTPANLFTIDIGAGTVPIDPNTTYYVIVASATTIKLALTLAKALDGLASSVINIIGVGSGTHAIHRRYTQGDLIYWQGAGHGVFYCAMDVSDNTAPPADTLHWFRQGQDGVYQVPHPYVESELTTIDLHQDGSTVTMTHLNRPQAELRRISALRWLYNTFQFSPIIAAPVAINATSEFGNYQLFTSDAGTPNLFTTAGTNPPAHGLLIGDSVYCEGNIGQQTSFPAGGGSHPAGFYEVVLTGHPSPGAQHINLRLRNQNGGATLTGGGGGGGNVYIRRVEPFTELRPNYRVTAIDVDGLESLSSNTVTPPDLSVNLTVEGSSITVNWNAVPGAVRYNVYRKKNNVYGFIGRTDDSGAATYAFKDENLTIDFSRTLSIQDTTLGGATTDFLPAAVNTASEIIVFTTAHKLTNGAPIRFSTTGVLPAASPSGLTIGVIYYAIVKNELEIRVALSPSDAAIGIGLNFSDGGLGTHTIHRDLVSYPATVTKFDERRFFGRTFSLPSRLWSTRVGSTKDLTFHVPVLDDDRLRFTPSSPKAFEIRHLVPLKRLVVLSDTTEFQIVPVNSEVLAPNTIESRAVSNEGASILRPSVIASNILYGAARGGHLLEIGESSNGELGRPGDMCLRCEHLFDGETLLDQTVMKAPTVVNWVASSNGLLLGLTYIPQEQVGAWHAHDTPGFFESVSAGSEGDEDVLYAIVRRTINGQTVRSVERMAERRFTRLDDAYFVDAGGSFDFTNTTATEVTLSESPNWLKGESVKITASASLFITHGTDDVGDYMCVRASQTGSYFRVKITSVTSTTVAMGVLLESIPAASGIRNTAKATWAFARDTIRVPHLEAATVQILGDALVQPTRTVASGLVTLATPAITGHVGLQFLTPLELLPAALQAIEAAGQDREVNVAKAHLRLLDACNFKIGPSLDAMVPSKLQADPGKTLTKKVDIALLGTWQPDTTVFILIEDPVPFTVLGTVLEVSVGGG